MNTELTEIQKQELKDYFNVKVHPRYKPKTIENIIEVVNKIRIGEFSEMEFVNPITKILRWQDMLEIWGLYKNKIVELK